MSDKTPISTILQALKTILQLEQAHSQEDIIAALQAEGHPVNQSKVSRLLRKLGAVKTTNDTGNIIYTLPREPAPTRTRHILSHFIINIVHNETLIIIYTNPGSASVIARLMDHKMKELGILGTVAGDDTIFAAPLSIKNIKQITNNLKKYLEDTL